MKFDVGDTVQALAGIWYGQVGHIVKIIGPNYHVQFVNGRAVFTADELVHSQQKLDL